jgi:hypothetical protein
MRFPGTLSLSCEELWTLLANSTEDKNVFFFELQGLCLAMQENSLPLPKIHVFLMVATTDRTAASSNQVDSSNHYIIHEI